MKTFNTYLVLVLLLIASASLNIYQWLSDGAVAPGTAQPVKEAATTTAQAHTMPEPKPQPAAGAGVSLQQAERTLGCDLSHWDGDVNWIDLKKANVEFVFVKATQGDTYVDPKFEENWVTSKNYGMHRGAYHFFQPGSDAKAQAEHFLSTVKHTKGDIVPVLDIEIAHGVDPEQLTRDVKLWVDIVEKAIGRYPIIYTDRSFWDKNITEDFSHCPLWLAEWESAHAPYLPKGWKNWAFWQYTQTGYVNGVKAGTKVDLNHFNGTVGSLRHYMLN
ncbi:glycoside hydrolase family 25 protein [Roseivirga sp. BDSF3-8]|uniref:glycoside hydrolase family 25 protein n=1 Tax=Roseivirga sp. BDSF3-8 TaxID=3241598 RepID=UPI003531A755